MNTRGEKTKSLVLALALLLSFVSFSSAKADSQVQTFSKDLDFSVWSMNQTELAGSDGGVKLSVDPASGGFYPSGTLTYKFSPGGLNRWTSATSAITAVENSDAWFAWEGNKKANKVMQLDPVNGSLVKDWVTNTTPLAGVGGGNSDYWVTNSVPYQASGAYSCTAANRTAGLCYSVSHIIPAENKIITRAIPTTTNRNLITISIDKVNHDLWIGDSVNKEVIVVDYTNFDNTAQALSYETIATTMVPYKSVFSQGAQAFCFTSFEVGFECLSSAAQHTEITVSKEGANEIFLDEHDDVWFTGLYNFFKYRPDFSSGAHFDSQSFFNSAFAPFIMTNPPTTYAEPPHTITEIAILSDETDYSPKDDNSRVIWARQAENVLHYLPLRNKALPQTSELSSKLEDVKQLTSVLNESSENYRHSLNVSPNGDIIYMGTSIAYKPEIINYADYLKNRFYDVAPKTTEYVPVAQNLYDKQNFGDADKLEPYVYFDNFIASGLGSTDTGVKIEYSIDNNSFVQANADGSIPLNDSADLYIKVTLSGFRSSSPVLKSLSISYQSSLGDNLKTNIDRSMYKSASDRDNGTGAISTFEKGQRVFVRTKIYEPTLKRENVTIEETLAGVDNFTVLPEKNFTFKTGSSDKCTSTITDRTINAPSVSGQAYIFSIPFITRGLTCIDYEYTSS